MKTREMIDAAVAAIRDVTSFEPKLALILGTGLGGLGGEIDIETEIGYNDIPGFPLSTVASHEGRLLCGMLAGKSVVAMQGRFHSYEGYSLQQVTFPVRVMSSLGAEKLFVSNACGGMNPLWERGDLVLISDHINLLGDSPLVGENDDTIGPRFPDMSTAYDTELRETARQVAREQQIVLREGVYVSVTGPNLETPAEYRFLRGIGADIVGMSTVPEVIVGVHEGMKLLGVSIITDVCLPDALEPVDISKIIEVAAEAEPRLTKLIKGVVQLVG
ncbi:MAG: purine-nucleoside phosphorylase [Gemmatimonadetes bacterium]|nr:purine-nucleoside phosphorylase [Gemmatimonadota bacterium]